MGVMPLGCKIGAGNGGVNGAVLLGTAPPKGVKSLGCKIGAGNGGVVNGGDLVTDAEQPPIRFVDDESDSYAESITIE